MLMDNGQMPPVQPLGTIGAAQPTVSGGATGLTANGTPMIQQVKVLPTAKKDVTELIKTIVIIVVSLIAVTFIGLFIWMSLQYNEIDKDIQGRIDAEVARAKDEQATKMEAEFMEREKYPYKSFSGPVDYGQLSFSYPKTWSVYVADSATRGGDFNAYFNPNQVNAVGEETINALRVTIRDKSFDDIVAEYQRVMERKDADLKMESVTFGKDSNIIGNRYSGKIPNTEFRGYIVIFKIRDKTVIMQTDSSEEFGADFEKILSTVTFNA